MAQTFPETEKDFVIRQTKIILRSYQRCTGKELWPESADAEKTAREIFAAPFILLSSDASEDPLLNYGNQKGLELWEMTWDEMSKTRGRETAEAMEREERERFLEKVRKKGYVDDYRGIRISSKGQRFQISRATVWNLLDEQGQFRGQAAMFKEWRYLPARVDISACGD